MRGPERHTEIKNVHQWTWTCEDSLPYIGVSKNRGTPKWMVYNGKPLFKWMIWGYHYFRKHPYTPTRSKSSPKMVSFMELKIPSVFGSDEGHPNHQLRI